MARILVVDDERHHIVLIRHTLEGAGHQVLSTTDSREVLGLANEYRPDIITLDDQMPHKSGLDIVKELQASPDTKHVPVFMIAQSKEQISIDKHISAGALVYLTKPLNRPEFTKLIEQTYTDRVQKEAWRRKRVLVLDDESKIRNLICQHLKSEGYMPVPTNTLEEALDMIRCEPPDMIILETHLEVGDGYGIIRGVRNNPETKNIPIIIVTKNCSNTDNFRGWQSGMDARFVKPVHYEEVMAMVTRIFDTLSVAPEPPFHLPDLEQEIKIGT